MPDILITSGGALVKKGEEYIYKAEFSETETRNMIDINDFSECALKMCVEIFDENNAKVLAERLAQCDCIRFSDGYWYKFTKKNVTKENAITRIAQDCGIGTESAIAFGDDFADIGMLELCGLGVAMGNAIDEVKSRADIVAGSNDEEGIAHFIEELKTNKII